MNGLMGRVAVITGGTGALGRVVSETFLRAEANEQKKEALETRASLKYAVDVAQRGRERRTRSLIRSQE
jgi:NAD(P)-dependent dehydrogenase (short-subunit alcohol dehydrogenase family)